MRGKRKVIEHQNQQHRNDERRTGKDGRSAQPRAQPQPLLQARNIGTELRVFAHIFSRCVPR